MTYRGRPENVVRPLDPWPEGWEEPVLLWRAHLDARKLAYRTIENYVSVLRRLAVETQKPPGEITRLDLLARQGRGIAPRSAEHERTAYRSFWEIIVDEGLVAQNPAAKLPKVKVRKGQPRPISMEQYAALFTAGRGARKSTQAMLILAGYVGMRASEIARVRGEMFDFTENTITYVAKGSFERTQPLHPVVRALAEKMPRRGYWFHSPNDDGKPVLAKSVSSLFSIRIRMAGIDDPRITGHSLRHMFATELSRAGTDLLVIQQLMGHELVTSTQIYALVDQSRKVDALAHLPIVDAPIAGALLGGSRRTGEQDELGASELSVSRNERYASNGKVALKGGSGVSSDTPAMSRATCIRRWPPSTSV